MNELAKEIDAFEKQQSVVKVFGAIIYSNRHPHIKKVLMDEDYWLAFHEISGLRWVIFAARAVEGRREVLGEDPPGSLSMMCQLWIEPNENKELLEYLGIQSTEKPVFVIFTRLKNGKILKSIISLDDSSLERAYQRLSQVISDLTSAVVRVDGENLEDYESVFHAVNMTAKQIQTMDKFRKLLEMYQWLKRIKP